MLITFLHTVTEPPHKAGAAGETRDVEQPFARQLVRAGLAEPASDAPTPNPGDETDVADEVRDPGQA